MPNPTYIPPELVDQILNYATDENRDAKSLAKFSQINKQFNARFKPLLYTKWTYDGEKHSIRSLWKFLCTIIRDDDIARLVHSLDVRNWAFPKDNPIADTIVTQEELVFLQGAFRKAGMNDMGKCTVNDLKIGDQHPFMALLLTRLLHISTVVAHLPEYDPFPNEALHQSLIHHDGRPNMQTSQILQELSVFSERTTTYLETPGIYNKLYKLRIEYCIPFFNLPCLRKLSIFGLDVDGATHYCKYRLMLPLKHLTLANHKYSTATARDTWAMITMPEALTAFSFYQNDCSLLSPRVQGAAPISNALLLILLRSHRNSLEYLDVYRDSLGYSPPIYCRAIRYFGSLHEFDCLKNLSIQPEALLGGGNSDEPRAPFSLKDTLSSSLTSLTLYGVGGLVVDLDLEEQFREVLLSGKFPHLKSVIFEDISYDSQPYEGVKKVCKDAGVTFLERKGKHLLKGGTQLPWV